MKFFIAILTAFTTVCIFAQVLQLDPRYADWIKEDEPVIEEAPLAIISCKNPCPPGYRRNPVTCQCECWNIDFPENQCIKPSSFRNDTCRCDCPPKIETDCGSDRKYFSLKDCQCHCIEGKCTRCVEPYVWSEETCNCECREKITCPGDSYWNDKTCQCECVQKRECCKRKYWSDKACDCVCEEDGEEQCNQLGCGQWYPQICYCGGRGFNLQRYLDYINSYP